MLRPIGIEWIEPDPLPADRPSLHPDPLLDELLYRRGVRDLAAAADFLNDRRRPAPNPYLLPGLAAAVERVSRALEAGETIAVYGDYDLDGITSTALIVRALRAAGEVGQVAWRLPTRAEGYGLNPAAVEEIAAAGARLLIAVDCASSDDANVALARARGLDVVVLDHHHMRDGGPEGAIVVSAQLAQDGAYHELAAVGVAYLLVAALAQYGLRVDGADGEPETDLLDFVALGTIGDIAPLTGANRSLVRDGLRRIQERPRVGLAALCRRAGVEARTLTADQVAFKLGPRLNAAGRMGDPALAIRLLLADDPREAAALADELERLNGLRRVESQRIVTEVEALLQTRPDLADRRLLVLASRGWTGGVLGIAASQLVARHGRPVVILNDDGQVSRGSARSVPGFDITGALAACGDLLDAHGGHSQAAGLSVPTAHVGRLEIALEEALTASALPVPLAPRLRIDAELPAERLALQTAHLLNLLAPFGTGNEAPRLRLRGVRVRQYEAIGRDRSHLRLHLTTPRGTVRAVCWSAADRSRELLAQPLIDLVATVGIDHWDGQSRLEVEVKDFRPAAT